MQTRGGNIIIYIAPDCKIGEEGQEREGEVAGDDTNSEAGVEPNSIETSGTVVAAAVSPSASSKDEVSTILCFLNKVTV